MTPTVCQTRDVGATEELSQAGGDTRVAVESPAANARPQQLVLWELQGQQVTSDFTRSLGRLWPPRVSAI